MLSHAGLARQAEDWARAKWAGACKPPKVGHTSLTWVNMTHLGNLAQGKPGAAGITIRMSSSEAPGRPVDMQFSGPGYCTPSNSFLALPWMNHLHPCMRAFRRQKGSPHRSRAHQACGWWGTPAATTADRAPGCVPAPCMSICAKLTLCNARQEHAVPSQIPL